MSALIGAGEGNVADRIRAAVIKPPASSPTASNAGGGFMGAVLGDLFPGLPNTGNTSGVATSGMVDIASGKKSAERNYAAVTRAQYRDWEQRFLPQQRKMLALASNETLAREQLARTDGLVSNSLRQAQLGQQNQMARMGVAQQQDANDNSLGLRQALVTAGTKNATREHERDRQLGILTGADAGTREKLQAGGM